MTIVAEFLELNNDSFNVWNSRGTGVSEFKSYLTKINIREILYVFQMVEEVYQPLEDPSGNILTQPEHRTGF